MRHTSQITDRKATVKRMRRRAARSAKENSDLRAGGVWVRYMSHREPAYRILISPRMVQELGPPLDPWGEKMKPASGVAPRRRATTAAEHRA